MSAWPFPGVKVEFQVVGRQAGPEVVGTRIDHWAEIHRIAPVVFFRCPCRYIQVVTTVAARAE